MTEPPATDPPATHPPAADESMLPARPVDRRGNPILGESEPPRTERRRRQHGRGGGRSRGFKVVLVLLILALPFLGAFAWFLYQLDPPGSPGKQVEVTIKPGLGVGDIGDVLARDHVIGSSLAFKLYAAATGNRHFEAGNYTLHEDLGVRPSIGVLKRGPKQVLQTLALPPGLTIQQIADRVGKLPGRSAAKLLSIARSGVVRSKYSPPGNNALEGLTYPDTY